MGVTRFYMHTDTVKNASQRLDSISNQMRVFGRELAMVEGRLAIRSSTDEIIRQTIRKSMEDTGIWSDASYALSVVLENIGTKYETSGAQVIKNCRTSYEYRGYSTSGGESAGMEGRSAGSPDAGTAVGLNYLKKLFPKGNELFDFLSKCTKLTNSWENLNRGQDQNKGLKTVEDFFSFLAAYGLTAEAQDMEGQGLGILKFFKGGLKLDKDIISLLDKYCLNDANKAFTAKLGDMVAGMDIIYHILKDLDDNDGVNSGFFKDSGNIVSSVKDFVIDTYLDHSELEGFEKFQKKYTKDSTTGGAVTALINMVIYAAADGYEKFQDGISWTEVGEWFEGIGLTGMNALTESATFGFAKVDTETAINNFKETENFALDIIDGWDVPVGVKAAACIPASIPVAIWAVGKSFFDYGQSIGDGIKKIIFSGE